LTKWAILIGCFDNYPPFNNAGNYLPVSPDVLKTEFLLFTRKDNQEQLIDYKNKTTLENSKYEAGLPLKLVIHGFAANRSTEWFSELKNALLRKVINSIKFYLILIDCSKTKIVDLHLD
jgi:hypothetical protein